MQSDIKMLAIFWQDQRVGYIENPKVDMFHCYGTFIAEGPLSEHFVLAIKSRLQQWDEHMGGVCVTVGSSMHGEVTDLDHNEINIFLSPKVRT